MGVMRQKCRYYGRRVLDYLDEFGFPLRWRSLLVYERAPAVKAAVRAYGESGRVGPITGEEFCSLKWPGDPLIITQSNTWRGHGRHRAIAAVNCGTMDGFCWLEGDMTDIPFLDMQCALPPGTMYLSRVWVYPSRRGQGIGAALLEVASACASEMGAVRLVSGCVANNVIMQHLYRQLGWTFFRRIDYLRIGPALCCSLRIESARPERVFSLRTAGQRLFWRPQLKVPE